MNEFHFTSADELKDAFQIDQHPEYERFTPYTRSIGFSVQRPYPSDSKFRPPQKSDGSPDTYALIGVNYDPNEAQRKYSHRIPISLTISVHSRYISNHLDYNFDDDECPTEQSVFASKRSPRPLDLVSFDEYFYDHQIKSFIDQEDNNIEGIQILNKLYQEHLGTISLKGYLLRWRMGTAYRTAAFCRILSDLFKWLLKTICGRTISSDDSMRGFFKEYKPEDLKLLKTERIDVFGYKASKNVIVTFCLLLLMGYFIFYVKGYSPAWIKNLFKHNLLSFAFAILSISILDHILPRILFFLVNLMIKAQSHLITKRFNFN